MKSWVRHTGGWCGPMAHWPSKSYFAVGAEGGGWLVVSMMCSDVRSHSRHAAALIHTTAAAVFIATLDSSYVDLHTCAFQQYCTPL